MSAERSTDSMIDVLYGEIPEEEARELRAELGAEVDELDGMLGRIRESMPREEVSPAVHASIMEAARTAAANHANGNERALRRTPAEAQGFWRRVGRTQGSQLALVAAVLVAGLFVVRAVEKRENPMMVSPASISEMQEAAPPAAMKAIETEESPGESAEAPEETGGALADQWSEGGDAPADRAAAAAAPEPVPAQEMKPAEVAVEESLRQELARSRDLAKDSGRGAADKAAEQPAKRKAPTSSTRTVAPAAKPAPKQQAKAEANRLDGLLDQKEMKRTGAVGSASNADEASLGLLEDAAPVSAPAAAEPMPDAEAKPAEYRPPANSIDAVNQYFRAGDYGGAIRAADEFLEGNGGASATERATAMHVKAQSLEKQGKYTEADRIYVAIQKNYPAYNPGQINNAREEIRRKNAPRPTKKARSKADTEKSYDFDDSAVSY